MSGAARELSPLEQSIELLTLAYRYQKFAQRLEPASPDLGTEGLTEQLASLHVSMPDLKQQIETLMNQLFIKLKLNPKAREPNQALLNELPLDDLGHTLWIIGRILIAGRIINSSFAGPDDGYVITSDSCIIYETALIIGLEIIERKSQDSRRLPPTAFWAHAYLLISLALLKDKVRYHEYNSRLAHFDPLDAETPEKNLSNRMWTAAMYLYARSFPKITTSREFIMTATQLVTLSKQKDIITAATQVLKAKDWSACFEATVCRAFFQQKKYSPEADQAYRDIAQHLKQQKRDPDQVVQYTPEDLTLADSLLP